MCRSDRIAPLVLVFPLVCLFGSGCGSPAKNADSSQPPVLSRGEEEAAISKAQVPISAGSEADLVERTAGARAQYRDALESLLAYYKQYGYIEKGGWVEKEMRDLRSIPRYPYLSYRQVTSAPVVSPAGAKVPPQPKTNVAEADALYEQARKLHKEAVGFGAALSGGKDKLESALKLYRQLIDEYPTSDKVSDASFYLAEIYASDAYKEYTLALTFYQKCLETNPNTEQPALFRIAVVYDHHLRDRDKAVAIYRQVIQSGGNRANVRYAQERIRVLTEKTSHEAPDAEPRVAPR
jgi:TolA-binding protein